MGKVSTMLKSDLRTKWFIYTYTYIYHVNLTQINNINWPQLVPYNPILRITKKAILDVANKQAVISLMKLGQSTSNLM